MPTHTRCTLSKLTFRSSTRGPLNLREIRADLGRLLKEGTAPQFHDPDLGQQARDARTRRETRLTHHVQTIMRSNLAYDLEQALQANQGMLPQDRAAARRLLGN